MSFNAFLGALELGLIYGIVAFGVFITYRLLDFPDLSVESTFPMGGAIAAALLVGGTAPWLGLAAAFFGGAAAGAVTAFLSVHCRIRNLLAGILTMIAAYSVNIRIMGRPNTSLLGLETIFSVADDSPIGALYYEPLLLAVLALVIFVLLWRLLVSDWGLALRAAGANPQMLSTQSGNPRLFVYCGLMLSNALVALGGALFSYANGFADITTGVGTIVYGLAAVIVGQTLLPSLKIWMMLLACLLGAVLYRLFIALALSNRVFGLQASDLYLVTALLVVLALAAPLLSEKLRKRKQ